MKKLDVAELRSKIDLDNLYVDFSILRSAISVSTIARDSGVELSVPAFEGDCRGTCPKCKKEKSFTLNLNTNRFNCFGKGCKLRGGGAIDFFAKLHEVSAKETSHLLACAYGIQPYSSEQVAEQDEPSTLAAPPTLTASGAEANQKPANPKPTSRGVVTRGEFDDLKARFERLSNYVWDQMAQNGSLGNVAGSIYPDIADEYDPPLTNQHITQ
jgi:hypothetical protein